MKQSTLFYVAEAKRALGDLHMSDRQLGEHIGYSQQYVSKAKCGYMTDPVAIKIAEVIGRDAGEVLLVARAEREPDQVVKAHLMRYAKNVLRSVPSRAVNAVAAVAVALSSWLAPEPTLSHVGGEGGIRTHVTA